MASKVKTPTFETTINRVLGQVVDSTLSQAYDRGERLRRGLTRLNSLFYRTLSQKAVGASGPPQLEGGYTPGSWKSLSKNYVKQKGHDRFYQNKGKLGAWLSSASAADILGPPVVTLSLKDQTIGEIRGFQKTIIRTSTRGKRWVQTLTFADYRSTGMRGFIKSKELVRHLQPFLSVKAFSKLPVSFGGSGDVARWLTGGRRDEAGKPLAYRFMNFRGQENRPIVSHYLGWWIDVRVRRIVDRFGKIEG